MSGDFPSDVDLPKVEIHTTEVCNNRCSFCSTGWLMREKGEDLGHPSRESIRKLLEEAYARGARRALFQGGEPTLRRDLGDLLADAHDLGYQATTIFTNGRMAASKPGARWLVAMNVTWFQISIQGGSAEAHDASVGAKGAFAQTIAGTRRLIEAGQRVKINAVLTRHLLDSLGAFADLMIELKPEEIGLDTVKPSGAFGPARESYGQLVPRLSPYSASIRDAMLAMDRAGLVARLTSFPPCLVPGIEHLVSEEAGTTQAPHLRGAHLNNKLLWKRSMQVKSERCTACAYDGSCGGLYTGYAEQFGLDELLPLGERRPQAPVRAPAAPDTPFTRILRRIFVGRTVQQVNRLADGTHELVCGNSTVLVADRTDAPAYARTARFNVWYRSAPDGGRPSEALLRALVQRIERTEELLRDQEGPAPPPHDEV